MKCPNRDEWVPYVFGEATPDARQRLSAHLKGCPECAAEIAGWKRSLGRLDQWKLPEPEARRENAQPALRWAMAALIVLGLGFGLGTVVARGDAESNRARIETSVRASLSAELQTALAHIQVQLSNGLESAEARVASASNAELRRLARGLVEAMDNARQEDRQATQALLETFQQQHEVDLISLRTDLETVASLADDQIRQAETKLIQFAAGNTPTP